MQGAAIGLADDPDVPPFDREARNRLFLHYEQGELLTARLTADGCRAESRALLAEATRPVQRRTTIWSHPAFATGSAFARIDREIVRVDLTERGAGGGSGE